MNITEIRESVVAAANAWVGLGEFNLGHKPIIDAYNSLSPLPRGYRMKYKDAWCAAFVSAVGIVTGLSDIIFRECSAPKMVNLYKRAKCWQESDSYTPTPGDVIFYDWDDSGLGDCTGNADHVGIVTDVRGNMLTIVEGNKNNKCEERQIRINSRFILGYGIPDYKSKVTDAVRAYATGELVNFNGRTHYTTANGISGYKCNPGPAVITRIVNGAHPYHLIAVRNGGSSVYGWVNKQDIY